MSTKKMMIAISLMCLLFGLTGLVLAEWEHQDENEHEEREHGYLQRWFGQPKPVIDSVTWKLYTDECGSCHFAYQPGLLPAQSWERIMAGLEDHFGENAELDEQKRQQIAQYLMQNSAGQVPQGLPQRISASLGSDNPPLRVTETRFFRHEHDEIPQRLVTGNDKVRSFSNCDACHTRAKQGSFREHEIRIPGFGRWDD